MDEVSDEEVTKWSRYFFQKNKKQQDYLLDWYSTEVDRLPIQLAKLACQRTNCYWDADIRNNYANTMLFILITVPIIISNVSFFSGSDVPHLALSLNILTPFFFFLIDNYSKQRDAADRIGQLRSHILSIWEFYSLKRISVTEARLLEEKIRNLQDQIFIHRSTSPLLFDFVYKIFRNKNEAIMNESLANLADKTINRR
jgi:hypothetical protein